MSDEKIKVVYSWIGPRGPIWNTELPNVLSLAGVSEGIKELGSERFWNDEAWIRLFRFKPNEFEIYPACAITYADTRKFVVPFSLAWRIDFDHYFLGNTGLLEFGHLPGHISQLVRTGQGFILINHGVEAHVQPRHLNALHSYFKGTHGFPLNRIIYLTGCINAKELYDEYCIATGIPDLLGERLSIIPYPSSMDIFGPNTRNPEDEPHYDTERVPNKLFLMWNRRPKDHRITTALILEKNNLVDRSYISFGDVDFEHPSVKFIDLANNAQLPPDITTDIIQRFNSKLPLVLDGETNTNMMCEDRNNQSRPFYQNSLVSIVTETNFDQPEVTLTEKSFKPFKEKHPFITVGVPGSLKGLRDLGFKTFSAFWNEDYDETPDRIQRLGKISDLTKQIGSWDNTQIINFRRNVKPILDYNYAVLKSLGPHMIVDKIAEVINTG